MKKRDAEELGKKMKAVGETLQEDLVECVSYETGEIQAVCDQCKKKQPFTCVETAVGFLRKHRDCNFSGCRVVRIDFPCPNRQRDYEIG